MVLYLYYNIVPFFFKTQKLNESFSFLKSETFPVSKAECGRRDLNPSFKLGKLK
jgi:hypothetical protein